MTPSGSFRASSNSQPNSSERTRRHKILQDFFSVRSCLEAMFCQMSGSLSDVWFVVRCLVLCQMSGSLSDVWFVVRCLILYQMSGSLSDVCFFCQDVWFLVRCLVFFVRCLVFLSDVCSIVRCLVVCCKCTIPWHLILVRELETM